MPSLNVILETRANANWNSQHICPYGENWNRSTFGLSFPELWPGGGMFPECLPNLSLAGYQGFSGAFLAQESPTTDIQFSPIFPGSRASTSSRRASRPFATGSM